MLLNASRLVLAILPLYVLVPWAPFVGPINTNDILPLACGLAAVVSLWESRRSIEAASRPWLFLTGIGLLMFLSHWLNNSEGAQFRAMARTLGRMGLFGVIGASISLMRDDSLKLRLVHCFVLVVLIQAIFGTSAAIMGWSGPLGIGVVDYPPGHFPLGGWARAQGTFGGVVPAGELFVNRANFYSAFLMIGLFVALHAWHKKPRVQGICVLLILAGIVASGSRMSLLAALVGLVVYALLKKGVRSLLVASGLVCLSVLSIPALRDRFTSGISDRITLWKQAVRVIQDAPWLGVGDGRYIEVLTTIVGDTDAVLHSPHHSILYAGATFGLPIAFALVCFYGWLVCRAYHCRASNPALGALVIAYICHDMTNNLFFVPEVALSFWIAWALLDPPRGEEHD